MPHWNWKAHPDGVTQEEFHVILELRKATIRQYADDPSTAMPQPIMWRHGWKTHWRLLGRDSDGSLLISVVIEGPRGEVPYTRKYRLVRRERLPWELGRGLRES
jgi:hypothetical protein